MKLKNKLSIMVASLITTISSVVAHSGEEGGTNASTMMWSDGSWMHNSAHMAGYNMWGLGWLGILPGLIIWALAILGIIYLYQKITEE